MALNRKSRLLGVLLAPALFAATVAVPNAPVQASEVAPPSSSGVEDDPCDPSAEESADAIRGTTGDDVISGTPGVDLICGYGGNDVIEGGDGDDFIFAGAGDDKASGGNGHDFILGEAGDDVLDGGAGGDQLLGGAGADELTGGADNDNLNGGEGADRLNGSAGNDILSGGDGDDHLTAAAGDDRLDGGPGTDRLHGASGKDTCDAGEDVKACETIDVVPPTPAHLSIATSELAAGPRKVISEGLLDGLRVEVDSPEGLLYPGDIRIRPRDDLMSGIAEMLAGPVLDIQLPDVPIAGARLTLPYDEANLHGFPEADLTVHTFDEERQLWMPVAGSVVDQAANSVTVSVEHFSAYAVLKVRSPADWKRFFGDVPLLCASSGGSATGFDVAMTIDTSGSMSTYDPTGLRVDGAKRFVDAMRDTDKAAVIGFASSATTYLPLTQLGTPEARVNVATALERTRRASGGTSIGSAVSRSISVLANGGGPDRQRVTILMTDGYSSYSTSLTAQAAEAGVTIHTIGLGNGVNDALLQGIADGTGGTYRHLASAEALPALYEDLAGDIIDSGSDGDDDGLTDCEERDGMFTAVNTFIPDVKDADAADARFTTSNPEKAHTDTDGLKDGQELLRTSLVNDREAAKAYSFLIDAGVTHYFRKFSNPNKTDTDSDGLNDRRERRCELEDDDCDAWPFPLGPTNPLLPDTDGDGANDALELLNGVTDGATPDRWTYAAGLELPFTLLQPDRYGQLASPEAGWQRQDHNGDSRPDEANWMLFRNPPITYDNDGLCVSNCVAIDGAVGARNGDDNGTGICVAGWFGTCLTEADQERRVITDARLWQGVFNADGHMTNAYLTDQALFVCSRYHTPDSDCDADAISDVVAQFASVAAMTPARIGTTTSRSLNRTLPGGQLNVPQLVVDNIAILIASQHVGGAEAQPSPDAVEEMTRACVDGPAATVASFSGGRHPCETMPIFAPGSDVLAATDHKADALLERPELVEEMYESRAEVVARLAQMPGGPYPPAWYNRKEFVVCTPAARAQMPNGYECDEFPYFSSTLSGPGASLRLINPEDNQQEGTWLSVFYDDCDTKVKARRVPYLVVPMPGRQAPSTMWTCGL